MFQVTVIVFIVLGTVATEPQQTNIITKFKSLLIPDEVANVEPEKFTVKFLLYTHQDKKSPDNIFIKPPNAAISPDIRNSKFNDSVCTKIIIHGYKSYYATEKWLIKMLDQFLTFTKCNVIVVDWSEGSNGTYAQAYANTRTAAHATAEFIKYLKNNTELSLNNIHILGCSLGAHTAGFAGNALEGKIGRITGLDPARPGFTDPKVDRLNSTNAAFVDVIHSDVYTEGKGLQAGFGINLNIGHLDFWPNNGVGAPDCIVECMKTEFAMQLNNSYTNTDKEKNLLACMSCSHAMAANYYVDTINGTNPEGKAYQNEASNAPMYAIIGENAILSKPQKNTTKGKSYYLIAKPYPPYYRTVN